MHKITFSFQIIMLIVIVYLLYIFNKKDSESLDSINYQQPNNALLTDLSGYGLQQDYLIATSPVPVNNDTLNETVFLN